MKPIFENQAMEIFDFGNNIIFWKYKPGRYVELHEFKEIISFSKEYATLNGKYWFVVEAPNSMNFTVEVWHWISENYYEENITLGVSFYSTGLQHKLMGKSYERKVQVSIPVKMCEDFDDCIQWINSQKMT